MIVNQELVKKIKSHFDLNIYETKVWLALISKGIASAREVADLSGVPRSRTYDVLESLEKQSFVILKLGKPVKFIAVKPTIVLERLKNNVLRKVEEKTKFLEQLKDTEEYKELEKMHNSSFNLVRKEDLSGAIKGKSNIYMHMKEMLENAKKEVVVCFPASELVENSRTFKRIFKNLKDRRVRVKLYLKGTEDDINKAKTNYCVKPDNTAIDGKFFLVDNSQVLVSLNKTDEKEDESAIWVNSKFFASALDSLFNGLGKK